MKIVYTLLLVSLTLLSCGKDSKKSVDEVIATKDLKEIRNKKTEIVTKQKNIAAQLKELNEAIAKLDVVKKVPLVTTLKIKDTIFNHFLELQGNVSTKSLLVIYPEYSGILTHVYVKEGEEVKKGQLLAKIDDGGLSQQLNQIEIQYALAKTTYERQKRLWDQKIGSELQFLQAKSNYEAQEQAVNQLKQQVGKTYVRAPFNGTIDNIITDEGSVVAPGQSQLMRIVNLDNMYIETEVPEKFIANISVNKNVQINFPILGETMHAKIRQVGNYINPANRTFRVEIAIPNTEKNIKPNLTARLKINDYTNPNAILIPQSIISENARGKEYIYVIQTKGKKTIAKKTTIETGKTQGGVIEITAGLKKGDEIIIEGARSVNNDQTVEILNP